MATAKNDLSMEKVDGMLTEYLVKKAPALPTNVREFLVKVAPWLAILGVVLSVPALLALFGLGAMMSSNPFGAAAMATAGFSYYLSMIFLIAVVVLEAMAIPGLMNKTKKGWMFMYYSVLVSGVSSLVSGNVVGMLVGLVIGLYFLYQVKEYYK